MILAPDISEDADLIGRIDRECLFGMFAERCGADGPTARDGHVPKTRLYVRGGMEVHDLDVRAWSPDGEGSPVFGGNPTLVVDWPPKGPDYIGSLHLGMGGHGAVMLVEDGRIRFAIPGVDVDGRFALFDEDHRSLARMDWERTREAYAFVEGLEPRMVAVSPKPKAPRMTDGRMAVIGRVAERGYVPDGTPEPEGGWSSLGLMHGHGEDDDGTRTVIHRPGWRLEDEALWDRACAEYESQGSPAWVLRGLPDPEWLRVLDLVLGGMSPADAAEEEARAIDVPEPTLTDDQFRAVDQIIAHGHIGVGEPEPEGGWGAIGLVDDGGARLAATSGLPLARWMAACRAYRKRLAESERKVA